MAKTFKSGRRADFASGKRKRDLRDTIASLEASRRSFQRQLAGEIESHFSAAYLSQRVAEIDADLEGHRRTLNSL